MIAKNEGREKGGRMNDLAREALDTSLDSEKIEISQETVQYIFEKLSITEQEYREALEIGKKLWEECSVQYSASCIEAHGAFFGDIWPPGEHGLPKLDLYSALCIALPPDVLLALAESEAFSDTFIQHLEHIQNQQNTGENASFKIYYEQAKKVVLGLIATGLEFHVENFTAAGEKNFWTFLIDFIQNLKKYEAFQTPETESLTRVTAHLPFMIAKDRKVHDEESFRETVFDNIDIDALKQILQSKKIPLKNIDTRIKEIIQTFWNIERGFVDSQGVLRLHFEMFFLGYLDERASNSFESEEDRMIARELSKNMSVTTWKKQIQQMKQAYGVTQYTLHAAPLGQFLGEGKIDHQEYTMLQESLLELGTFAQEQKVVIQIETQGLTQEQWRVLFQDEKLQELWCGDNTEYGLGITVDLVHVWGEQAKDGDIRPDFDFWSEHLGKVTEVHVSNSGETEQGAPFVNDAHEGYSNPEGEVPGKSFLQEVVERNKILKEQKKRTIVVVQEATMTIEDPKTLYEDIKPKEGSSVAASSARKAE